MWFGLFVDRAVDKGDLRLVMLGVTSLQTESNFLEIVVAVDAVATTAQPILR
jgi:hypothetical protein